MARAIRGLRFLQGMKSFDVVPITETVSHALREGSRDDKVLLRVVPPKHSEASSWYETGIELNRAFHRLDEKSSFLRTKNNSETYGMEIWYENESVNFYLTVPDEVEEDHFRRQISGRFSGSDIDRVIEREDKFLKGEEGEYIGATKLGLKRHFFEPLRHPLSDGDDMEDDPYQTLLPEIDTKDGARAMVQVLFRPAREKWTKLHFMDVDYYANRLDEDGITNSRLFGFGGDRVQSDDAAASVAMRIRQQEKKPAFHVDVRIVVIADSEKRVQHQLNTITTLYEQVYRTEIGQSLVPYGNTRSIIPQLLRRESDTLKMPTGIRNYFKFNFRRNCKYVILTIPELTGLVHFPVGSEINVDGITWNDSVVKGTLPPNAPKYQPVPETERAEWAANMGIQNPLSGDEELLGESEEESETVVQQ